MNKLEKSALEKLANTLVRPKHRDQVPVCRGLAIALYKSQYYNGLKRIFRLPKFLDSQAMLSDAIGAYRKYVDAEAKRQQKAMKCEECGRPKADHDEDCSVRISHTARMAGGDI